MKIPHYFSQLGISQSTTCDSTVRQAFISAWTALHQRIDLGIVQVQEEGEQLLMAFEMLQCSSSRECVQAIQRTGKLECRIPPLTTMPWQDALQAEQERNARQKQGTWTSQCEKDHEQLCDKAGYLWKKRSPPDAATFVAWVRYHCAFNAYAILGVDYDATPEQIQSAFEAHAVPDDVDEAQRANYTLCLQTALDLALCPRADRYRAWLAQGFVDIMHDHIPMRLPATRTNVLRALDLIPTRKPKRKAPTDTPLQQWLATARV